LSTSIKSGDDFASVESKYVIRDKSPRSKKLALKQAAAAR
jgi:hypothetical protein